MAIKYQFIDEKLGVSSPPQIPPYASVWRPATIYVAGASTTNGGFVFSTVAGGTSGAIGNIGPTPQNLVDVGTTWVLVGPVTGLGAADVLPQQELGYIALAKDQTYGVGEFIYVKFTGACVAGDFVFVDRFALTAIQAPVTALKGNLGLAMASQVANQYGWVMIRGVHDGANVVTAAAIGSVAGASGVLGRANISGTVAGATFDGVLLKTAAIANVATVELYWPGCSGR